jgi:hypothetical protein
MDGKIAELETLGAQAKNLAMLTKEARRRYYNRLETLAKEVNNIDNEIRKLG